MFLAFFCILILSLNACYKCVEVTLYSIKNTILKIICAKIRQKINIHQNIKEKIGILFFLLEFCRLLEHFLHLPDGTCT